MRAVIFLVFLLIPSMAQAFLFRSAEHRSHFDPLSSPKLREAFDNAANLTDDEIEIRFARFYEKKEKSPSPAASSKSVEVGALYDLSAAAAQSWDALVKCNQNNMTLAVRKYRQQNERQIQIACPSYSTATIRENIRNFVSSSKMTIEFKQNISSALIHPFFVQLVFEELNVSLYPISQDLCDPKQGSAVLKNCFFMGVIASDVFGVRYKYDTPSDKTYDELIQKYRGMTVYQQGVQIMGLWALSRILVDAVDCEQLGLWPGINSFMLHYSLQDNYFIRSLEIMLNYLTSYYFMGHSDYTEKGCVQKDALKKPATQAASQWVRELGMRK